MAKVIRVWSDEPAGVWLVLDDGREMYVDNTDVETAEQLIGSDIV